MLATSNVWGVDAAVRHVLWCIVLQTSMDRCTQLVLHPLRNVQPVQLVVQQMTESAVVLPRVADDASGSINKQKQADTESVLIACISTASRPWCVLLVTSCLYPIHTQTVLSRSVGSVNWVSCIVYFTINAARQNKNTNRHTGTQYTNMKLQPVGLQRIRTIY